MLPLRPPPQVATLRAAQCIAVEGPDDGVGLRPVAAFADAGFPADILKACTGFTKPSPIQSQVRPSLGALPACLPTRLREGGT